MIKFVVLISCLYLYLMNPRFHFFSFGHLWMDFLSIVLAKFLARFWSVLGPLKLVQNHSLKPSSNVSSSSPPKLLFSISFGEICDELLVVDFEVFFVCS